jgi:hypothetical protein
MPHEWPIWGRKLPISEAPHTAVLPILKAVDVEEHLVCRSIQGWRTLIWHQNGAVVPGRGLGQADDAAAGLLRVHSHAEAPASTAAAAKVSV